ncbi:MAG: hypothetical protein QY325_07150 [Flavobacteriales bacterium]|jgi:hypothetical protein|nr:MAG: hypothetical protein QY325_07150 [Flavobacteriales bacterium]
MRFTFLLLVLMAVEASAQFGIGVRIPVGRSTHRIGTVPDTLALYSLRELDIEPRCTEGLERWTEALLRMEGCPADTTVRQCAAQSALVLRYTVERDGTITDAQVVKGGCTGLNRRVECAAMRSSAWEPGRIGYSKVRTRMQTKVRPSP